MASRVAVAFLLALAAAGLPAVTAQGPVTLLEDPAEDQAVTSGTLVADPPAFPNVDIRVLSAAETSPGTVTLTLTASGPPSATQNVTISFKVAKGDQSYANSTASGDVHTLLDRAGTLSGIEGATRSTSGDSIAYVLPLSALGAGGGDEIADATVSIEDFDDGAAPSPVTQDDTRASDSAAGSSRYALARPARAPAVTLDVTGGTVSDGTGAAVLVASPSVTVRSANATVSFQLRVANAGTDEDDVTLSGEPQPGAGVSVTPSALRLAPGAAGNATATVTLADAPAGHLTVHVVATSGLGAQARLPLTIHVDLPGLLPEERTPVPESLGFLTPLATGIGLDQVLGVYAELGLLLFSVLLLVVAVYLALFLARTPWVRVKVTPRRAIVSPGGVAEFRVELEGRRKAPSLARATLRSEGPWTAGLQMGRSAARAGEPMDIPLETGPQEAVVRVQVPYDAPARDRQDLEFDVVPVDSEGGSHPKHAARAKVTVEASAPALGKYVSAHDIRLAEVRHDPPDPRPGATVRTTAVVHNDGSIPARLRIVLQKDGHGVAEETVDVPPHDMRSIPLPWQAGAGRNLVKVQIFLA